MTPLVKVDGVEACVGMLASKEHLVALESTEPGQLAIARFSEDQLLYRTQGQGERGWDGQVHRYWEWRA